MPILALFLFRFVQTPLERSCRRRGGERRSPRSARCLPAKTEATHIDFLRPTILGGAVPALDRLARLTSAPTRSSAGSANGFAGSGSAVEGEPTPSRATRDGRRDSTPHRTDGCRQPSLARTQDSRRVDNARHRDFRTYCLPNAPKTAAAVSLRKSVCSSMKTIWVDRIYHLRLQIGRAHV